MRLAVTKPSWDHQVKATEWALERDGSIIAYDMGTGKTKVAVDAARNSAPSGVDKVLVLCPKAVATNWEREIVKWWAGPRPLRIVNATHRTTAKAAAEVMEAGNAAKNSRAGGTVHERETLWVIVNYDRMSSANDLQKLLLNVAWDVIVLDEVHRCKGATTKVSKAVRKLRARRKIGLSGTPMPQGYADAFGILKAVGDDCGKMNITAWRRRYARPRPGVQYQWDYPTTQPEIDQRLAARMISCKSEDVLDLPDQHHVWLWVDMPAKVKAAYHEFEKELWVELDGHEIEAENALVKALRLQQFAAGVDKAQHDAKRAALVALAEELPADEPLVVFGVFTEELNEAKKALEKTGRACYMLTGQVKQHDDWRDERGGEVILCQMRAGSVGIDLTRAAHVSYLSTGFKSDDYKQSLKRCHRSGQERRVTYHHIAARGTIDERIAKVLAAKGELEDVILKRNEWRE